MSDDAVKPFCEPGTPQRWIRPRRVRVEHVDLSITIDLEAGSVEGVVEHRCRPVDAEAQLLELDQHGLEIRSVSIQGQPARFHLAEDRLAVHLPSPGRPCTVSVSFKAVRPAKGIYFINGDPAQHRVRMCWTQGAMEDHSWWFPCFDAPNNLATYRVAIRHRSELLAASGGVLESSSSADGWTTTTYRQERAHVLYLLTVVVGEFERVAQGGGVLPIEHLVPRGCAAQGEAMFRATRQAIGLLEELIGVAYPWQRYGHAVVHGFMWGGMENTTLTTITDRRLMTAEDQRREEVDCDALVVHELVHQWFGDLLTMKAWSDIWLNESFATYLEARITARYHALRDASGSPLHEADELAAALWENRQAYLDEDHARYRRPLVTNRYADAYELFDRVAYEKGSLVLHHLCVLLGEARFRTALQLYVSRHAHDLVETADVRQAIEDATGEPFDWFFAQWMYRAGHPRLKVQWSLDLARGSLVVDVDQLQASGVGLAEQAERLYRLPTAILWRDAAGVHRQAVIIERALEVLVLPATGSVAWVMVDPETALPAEWEEKEGEASLLARLADAEVPPGARARAAAALAVKPPTPALIQGLAGPITEPTSPRLVRSSCIAALGEMHAPAARDRLLALLGSSRTVLTPRLRRMLARACGQQKGLAGNQALADALVAAADAEESLWTAGELLAARAALELRGATPLLRARLGRESWQDLHRVQVVRGLGLCGEAPAIDEIAMVLDQATASEQVLGAACEAAGLLGQRHVLARPRLRPALERFLEHGALALRGAAARALATLGDPAGMSALSSRLAREPFGNVARVLREAQEKLGRLQAQHASLGELMRRLDDGEAERKRLVARLEAVAKRLESGPR